MRKKVLVTVTRFSEFCAQAKALLEANGFEVLEPCTEFPRLSFEELTRILPDIDAAIFGLDDWTEEVFQSAKKLKIMARFGLGVDNADLAAAKKHGIYVTNARESYNAVAEIAMSLLFACMRRTPTLDSTTKAGGWIRFVGDELYQKKVSFLGFGKIAQTLAKRLTSFDCQMFAYDLYPNRELAASLGVTILPSLKETIQAGQVVSAHLPATPETKNIFNSDTFALFNKGSYFINTARGALVDEKALHQALINGTLAAAGIDVFQNEPAENSPLFALDNFFCTPHQGAETYQTMANVGLVSAKAILDTFSGITPQNLLNE